MSTSKLSTSNPNYELNVEEFLRKTENFRAYYSSDYSESDCDEFNSVTDSRNLNSERNSNKRTSYSKNTETDYSEFDVCLDDSNEIDDSENEIYLSLYWLNNTLGASYYDSNKQFIYYLQDVQETHPKFETISLLLKDMQPKFIILSAKSDDALIDYIKLNFNENLINLMPNNDFNYDICKKRIFELKLKVFDDLNLTEENERYIYFKTFLNFESQFMIRSMGALVKYLDKNRINVQLEERSIMTPIFAFKSISLDNVLLIDDNSLKSLQIFHLINHPSVYKQNSNKDGLSLFSMYKTYLSTKIGVLKLRSWLLKPTRNMTDLRKRHEIIEFFLNNNNQEHPQRIKICIKNCKNMNLIFKRLKASQLNVSDWLSLHKTTENLIKLINICDQIVNNRYNSSTFTLLSSSVFTSKTSNTVPSFKRLTKTENETLSATGTCSNIVSSSNLSIDNLFECFLNSHSNFKNLNCVFSLLTKVLDIKKMNETKKISIQLNIDSELDHKKELYSNLAEHLNHVAQKELDILRLQQCNVSYIPQLGFLLAISFNENCIQNDEQRAKFEFSNDIKLVFKTEDSFFYKTKLTQELDEKFGDLASDINDIESKIINDLQVAISEYSYVYSNLIDLVAELDVCLAFAMVAKEYDYVKPQFHKINTGDCHGSFIYALKSRHPLLELVVNNFIPNDIYIGDIPTIDNENQSTIKIFTGPNACGKSIYMKQVALLVYMAYIGSFVPAKCAFIGDFDRIYTRLNSNDSISLALSTFSIDIQQISDAVNNYTNKSLIVIDEFGKGTQSTDGQALLAALIRYFLRNPPNALISTHFYEILNPSLFVENDANNANKKKLEYLTFEYICEKNHESNEMNIVHLYKLKRNSITNSSYAINIAEKAGLSKRILSRAQEILTAKRSLDKISVLQTQESKESFEL